MRLLVLFAIAAPLTAQLNGYLDGADCKLGFGGWAWDASRPTAWLSVDIYDGGTIIQSMLASEFRPDLVAFGGGRHAFNVSTVPSALLDGLPHTIHARVGAFELHGLRTMVCGAPKPPSPCAPCPFCPTCQICPSPEPTAGACPSCPAYPYKACFLPPLGKCDDADTNCIDSGVRVMGNVWRIHFGRCDPLEPICARMEAGGNVMVTIK